MYRLGTISSLSGGNLIVNGAESGSTQTYFSILTAGDEVILNEETRIVDTITNDGKFSVTVAFASGTSGDYLYSTSKCVWLKYQIWKLELAIANYDFDLLGIDTVKNSLDELKLNTSNTPISQLISLKSNYERQLTACEIAANDKDIWVVRRYEYGTL